MEAPRSSPPPAVAPWIPWVLTAAMLAWHWGLWLWTSRVHGLPLLVILDRWDSMLYSIIVDEGYRWPFWVFFPLYPGTVWLVRQGLGGGLPPQVVGCGVSTLCLLVFLAWNTRGGRGGGWREGLAPRTAWGWFFFVFGPASYTLHSHHTEGLFLLLSFGALACASRGALVPTLGWVALCVWTRNQGCLVAIAAALLLAGQEGTWPRRLVRFGTVGAVALLSFGGFLLFEWTQAGDPFAFMKAQREWHYVDSLWGAIRGLWFGNPWHEELIPWLVLRHVYGFFWLVAALALLRRGDKALGLYALLGLLVMMPQGDLGNAFRFSAVLFPMLFLVGDWLARRPGWLRGTVALLALWLNHEVTQAYALEVWAY